jgi:hypothetical protein
MKRSELRKIVEDSYLDLTQAKVGSSSVDPKTGIKSTLSAINPETGGLTWDIDYTVDAKKVYNDLDKLVKYMDSAKDGELVKIKDILKKLKNQAHRLIK